MGIWRFELLVFPKYEYAALLPMRFCFDIAVKNRVIHFKHRLIKYTVGCLQHCVSELFLAYLCYKYYKLDHVAQYVRNFSISVNSDTIISADIECEPEIILD